MIATRTPIRRLGLVARGLGLLAVAGCAITPNYYAEVSYLSADAIERYEEAKTTWAMLMGAVRGPARDHLEAEERIVEHLEAAIVHDPRCPLFASRIGAVRLGQGRSDEAEARFEAAAAALPDWVPGHLGLGRVALDQSRPGAAAQHLDNAQLALASLAVGGPPAEQGLTILGIRFAAPPDKALGELDRGEAHALLMNLLAEDLGWDLGRAGASGGASSTPDPVALLQARAELLAFELLRHRSPGDLVAQKAQLDTVRRLDPDLWLGKYWRAVLAHEERNYARGETLLRGAFFGKRGALLRQDNRVRDAYLRICTDWFLDLGDGHSLALARQGFHRLAQDGIGYLRDRAPLLFAAQGYFLGTDLDELEPLRVARDCLNEWRAASRRDAEMGILLLAALNREIEARSSRVGAGGGR